jgi:periplasmic divalent cation tolerance protein
MGTDSAPDPVYIVYCTCPNMETAQTLAQTLVAEDLAACVNILPGVTSVYRWEGQVETDAERLLIIKTTASCSATLTARIEQLHPYDVPEVIAHPITAGHEHYLNWVRQCTAKHS